MACFVIISVREQRTTSSAAGEVSQSYCPIFCLSSIRVGFVNMPPVRIVLCQMLQHLQLVWVPLLTSQIEHGTTLADSHFAERRRVHFVGLLAIAASICVDIASPALVFWISLHR
ncbi:hypothetical protein AVEN_98036-1 [Araneus ventricosus]|uniref:Uncharacterized protein n=1 Tax=Araneus ventricosus TaxID=182803 RepID=A0A4Y2G6P5_ARAVE|nr:hypothetical protein AVEN_98036-1 [Araneus ventricosus]